MKSMTPREFRAGGHFSARPRSSRRATSAVEFAVVAPVFFLMVLGVIEVGRGIMIKNLMLNAARAGVRAGVVEGTSSSTITTAAANVLSAQGITGDTATIWVNDNAADASTAAAGDEITVFVSIPVNTITWIPVPKYLAGNITSQYTMRRE